MNTVDGICAALLGGGTAALTRAAWLAVSTASARSSGRPDRTGLWGASGLVAIGCGVYARAMFGGRPPLHPAGTVAGAPWWQVAAVGAAVFATAVAAGAAVMATRAHAYLRARRHRGPQSVGDGDLDALLGRHDAVREQFGALLTSDPYRLETSAPLTDQLAAALSVAADLRPGASASYTQRSAYARAVGEAEAAWSPLADIARRHGLGLPDNA